MVLAVGAHTRLPRRYRGLDIHTWLDMMGTLDRTIDTIRDVDAARREPSLQLVGSDDGRSIDIAELQSLGVRIAGRVEGFGWGHAHFDATASQAVRAADRGLTRMLDRIDRWATEHGLDGEIDPVDRPAPVSVEREVTSVDLRHGRTTSILWSTGYRPDYSWLTGPTPRPDGTIDHTGGVVADVAGLYLLGLPVMRTRKSTFIDGVGADAEAHAAHIEARLAGHPSSAVATVSA